MKISGIEGSTNPFLCGGDLTRRDWSVVGSSGSGSSPGGAADERQGSRSRRRTLDRGPRGRQDPGGGQPRRKWGRGDLRPTRRTQSKSVAAGDEPLNRHGAIPRFAPVAPHRLPERGGTTPLATPSLPTLTMVSRGSHPQRRRSTLHGSRRFGISDVRFPDRRQHRPENHAGDGFRARRVQVRKSDDHPAPLQLHHRVEARSPTAQGDDP